MAYCSILGHAQSFLDVGKSQMSQDAPCQGLQHPQAPSRNTAPPNAQGAPSAEPRGSQEAQIKPRFNRFWCKLQESPFKEHCIAAPLCPGTNSEIQTEPGMEEKRRNVSSTSALIQCCNWRLRKSRCPALSPSAKLPGQTAAPHVGQAGSARQAPGGLWFGLYLALLVKQSTDHLPQQLIWELPVPVPPGAACASSWPGKGDGNLRPLSPNCKESVGKLSVHVQQEIRKPDKQSRTGAALFSE